MPYNRGMWIRRKVKSGQKIGRKLGLPTLNFNVGDFGSRFQPAVYACEVRIRGKRYTGALYFGPKLQNPKNVLELYVIGFSGDLYGTLVSFRPGKKIRKPKHFTSLQSLKKQIQEDVKSVV